MIASSLPRGLGLVLCSSEPLAHRLGVLTVHALAVHAAFGMKTFGLPQSLGGKSLVLYGSEKSESETAHSLADMLHNVTPRSSQCLETALVSECPYGGIPKPLRIQAEARWRTMISNRNHVALLEPCVLYGKQHHHTVAFEERMFRQLADDADRSETTISALTVVPEGIEPSWDSEFGDFWEHPALQTTRWSIHVLPTEDEEIYDIVTLANGTLISEVSLEFTGQGFRPLRSN